MGLMTWAAAGAAGLDDAQLASLLTGFESGVDLAAEIRAVQARREGAAKQARHPTLPPGLSVCQSTHITSLFHTIGWVNGKESTD